MPTPVTSQPSVKATSAQIYGPPNGSIQLEDLAWQRWLSEVVWPIIGQGTKTSGPQGTFPQIQTGKASFTNENATQELLSVNQGLYVNYFSTIENIIYGFACNVHRAKGSSFVVGAQINSWAETGSLGDSFGIACTATAMPTVNVNLISIEPDTVCLSSSNTKAKWGVNPVFKDRMDGATTPGEGVLGSNLYNYFAEGMTFTSQPRTATGEFCGWNCGIDFLDASLDQSSVPAWSAVISYASGMIVSSGGNLWKAIVPNTNNLPAPGSAFWVQHAVGTTNLAVGIDFSSFSTTSMGRMASAVRLRSSMYVHWDETGTIGTKFDAVAGVVHLVDNGGSSRFSVDVGSGLMSTSLGTIALGGGAGATLGTIGGSGPTVAAQNAWGRMSFGGVTYFIPLWI